MSNIVERLTENIVSRDLAKEGAALLTKWEKTGLLEGVDNDREKNSMAVLLENQAKELLREASSMGQGGDVEGFAAVAFPIVRRVFGGLLANDLVSVQPMSLPSGLIFFLDFQKTTGRLGTVAQDSVYGGAVVGQQITGGVNLNDENGEVGFYSLDQGYAATTGSTTGIGLNLIATGTVGGTWGLVPNSDGAGQNGGITDFTAGDGLVNYDPDLVGTKVAVGYWADGQGTLEGLQWKKDNYISITGSFIKQGDSVALSRMARRLTGPSKKYAKPSANHTGSHIWIVQYATGSESFSQLSASFIDFDSIEFATEDNFNNVGTRALGGVVGADLWGLEQATNAVAATAGIIPEIDIKVDSVSVTAVTKKLKAKWTPELGQDLNAYHNLDAEVELTSILSEQIALEIDREILNDLVKGATTKLYWSRSPGLFVNRESGAEVGQLSAAPDFTGTVSEWYETLLETINDVSARIHRKTLRGGANFVVTSPEVASIMEMTAGFRASVAVDGDTGSAGALKVGNVNKKWDVYVDPYFPRNLCLVGRKGNSFLESGYVYAPYVPLQVTPTIFGPEDFVPRKGVMTRYAKKMVRPDMYGLVVVRGLIGESGATS